MCIRDRCRFGCAVFVARRGCAAVAFGCWTRGVGGRVAASPRRPSQGDGIGAHGHDLEARGRRRRGERGVRGGPRAYGERRVGRAVRRLGDRGRGSPSVGTRPMGFVLGGGDLRPGARAGGRRRRGIGRLLGRRRCRNVRVVGGGHGAARRWRRTRKRGGYPFSGRDAPRVRTTNTEFGGFRGVSQREPRGGAAAEGARLRCRCASVAHPERYPGVRGRAREK